MSPLQIVKTGDGSNTLFVPELDEHYHSINGAVTESRHVFIDAGFSYFTDYTRPLRILEIGLGTGLNALLTIEAGDDRSIQYIGVEPTPMDYEIVKQMKHEQLVEFEGSEACLQRIHSAPYNIWAQITQHFKLLKLDSLSLLDEPVDLVYYDAFAPDVQPELWTQDQFQQIWNSLNNGGKLVTYCAKGEVRRNLQSVGFSVERLPGPPGKREMMRATKHV